MELLSVAEPKLFIFDSGSTCVHNFGSFSSTSYSHKLPLETVLYCNSSIVATAMQSWARDNFFASRQRQRDNVTEPQGPVRDPKKFEK